MSDPFLPLKHCYWGFLERHAQRKKSAAEQRQFAQIRAAQAQTLRKSFPQSREVRRLIVFLSPGYDIVNGGVMSIVSLFEETRRLELIHGAHCVLCSLPSEPTIERYTRFQNTAQLAGFFDVLTYFGRASEFLIHVPEYAIQGYFRSLSPKVMKRFKASQICHNVMLQNIDVVSFEDYGLLRELGTVTCTTAHRAYSVSVTAALAQCPIHMLSVFITPEKYRRIAYQQKQDLLIVSPDPHPAREAILEQLQQELPSLTVRIVQNIHYLEYKDLISRAKWALTFGEGLDGYFIETIFSGGVSFAVYNDRFFTEDFRGLDTVFPSYAELSSNLTDTIQRLDNAQDFSAYQKKEYEVCQAHYDYAKYIENLSAYYLRYWPKPARPRFS